MIKLKAGKDLLYGLISPFSPIVCKAGSAVATAHSRWGRALAQRWATSCPMEQEYDREASFDHGMGGENSDPEEYCGDGSMSFCTPVALE